MKIVFTLILASLFFTTAYAAPGDALPDVPDIAYHPLRDDVNVNVSLDFTCINFEFYACRV